MEKRCTRSIGFIDRGVAAVYQSIVNRVAARAAHLTSVVCTAGSGHGSSPRGLLEEKGGRGDPHRGRRWAAREWSEADDELQQWRLRAGRDEGWSSFGHGGKWLRRRGLLKVRERREAGDQGVTGGGSAELQWGGSFRL
jgi:hypothetical protein